MYRAAFQSLSRQSCRHLGSNIRLLRNVTPYLLQPTKFNLKQSNFCSTVTNQNDEQIITGQPESHEFQAETRKLLDIVARSLYSEKEVFIRELISNASDAIEKFRYFQATNAKTLQNPDRNLEIQINLDKIKRTITIADTGVGMSKQEMIENLGTIARSGSKAFMEQYTDGADTADPNAIIGQFGVGFYSAFMVADKIEAFSQSCEAGSAGYHWESDGLGTYSIAEAEGVAEGTKVVIHLKESCSEFADYNTVREIIKKYSSFVGSDLSLDGNKANDLKPVWLMDPKQVDVETHEDFYRYIGQTHDKPRFVQHFRTDAPMDIRALIYVPESKPGMFEQSPDGGTGSGVALYCRKVLIQSKTENIVPKWMRFVKGVVDSEDIPLNLSRELLQDSAQIRKLRTVITNKFLRFLQDKAKKEERSFMEFYKDYGFFLKEGILSGTDQYEKEEIAKLLRFESSSQPAGKTVSLPEYGANMKAGQRDIYYLAAPSRQLAESSPYFEALREKEVEILFCYEPYDELVLMQLQQFDKKNMTSVEKEMQQTPEEVSSDSQDAMDLSNWIQSQLGSKAAKVKLTKRLESHPCLVSVQEMAAARHFVKTQGANFSEEQRFNILQPTLEINPEHPIIKKLQDLKTSNPKLATLVTEQLFANAMVSAGLVDDPRTILKSMNEMMALALEKH